MLIFQGEVGKGQLGDNKLWKNKRQIKIQIDHQQVVWGPYLRVYSLQRIQNYVVEVDHVAEAHKVVVVGCKEVVGEVKMVNQFS